MKNFNLQDLFQLLSYVVAIISSVLTYIGRKNSDKNIRKIELTKQEFAKENEKLKRNQYLEDQKSKLISNFLGAINEFSGSRTFELKNQALSACGKVVPVCTPSQKKLVHKIEEALSSYTEMLVSDEEYNQLTKLITDVTFNFCSSEDQSK